MTSSTNTVTQQSLLEVIGGSSIRPSQLTSSSAAFEEGKTTDGVHIVNTPPAPVIAGMVVAVVVLTVIITLALLALACYKMKVSKRYTIDSMSKQNGETARTLMQKRFLCL